VCVFAGGAQAQDAKTLVGDWVGEWRSKTGSGGAISMTIDAVDRAEVRGSIFIVVAAPDRGYYNRDLSFSGVIEHGELRIWLPPNLSLALRIAGRTMQGMVQGQHTFGPVTLDKRVR
jgi:hypothetical protein